MRQVVSETEYSRLQRELLTRFGTCCESTFVHAGDPLRRTHFLHGGSGPAAVLLPGGGLPAVSWEPVLSRLQHAVSFYAVDRPDCGLTEKIDYRSVHYREHAVTFVRSVLDQMHLSSTVIIGNSMGGYFGIAFALAYPHRVSHLVLVGAPAGLDRHVPLQMRILGIRGLNRALYSTVARPSLGWTTYMFRTLLVADIRNVAHDYLECIHAATRVPGAELAWFTMLESVLTVKGFREEYYLRDEIAQLRIPVVFIWGDKDGFAPPSSGSDVCRRIPDARLEVIRNAGHLPWLDQPDETAAAILRVFS